MHTRATYDIPTLDTAAAAAVHVVNGMCITTSSPAASLAAGLCEGEQFQFAVSPQFRKPLRVRNVRYR